MAQGIITEIGRKKLCMAHSGDATLPAITHLAFGSGGIDSKGNVIETTGTETGLKTELLKKEIDSYAYTDEKSTTCRYTVKLGKAELANQNISEQGLYDADGDLIAYKTFLPKGKDDDMEFIFDMDEVF